MDLPELVQPAATPLSSSRLAVKAQEWVQLSPLPVRQFHYFVPSATGLIRKLLMDKQNQSRSNFIFNYQ